MSSNKRVHSILLQLHKAIKQLQTWNENVVSPDDYYTSPEGMKNLAASCMLIEAIGEGIKKIDELTEAHLLPGRPEIPWKDVIGMRNHIAHGYFDIDGGLVFDVVKNNLDDLVKLYKMCDDMKFNFLSISFLRNNNLKQNSVLFESFVPEFNANYPIQKYFDMEHFKEVYRELESLSKKSKVQIRFSPKFEYSKDPLKKIEEFFNYPADKPVAEIYKPCIYPYSNMMITPSGDVYPCLSQKIGNVKDMSIKEVFNLPHYRCFRKNLKAAKVFGACQMCCELCVK